VQVSVRKGRASGGLDAVHHLPGKGRVKVGVITGLAEVRLDGHHLVLAALAQRLHLVGQAHGLAQPLDFAQAVVRRVFHGEVRVIDGNSHAASLS
jgi:hypothetical protein